MAKNNKNKTIENDLINDSLVNELENELVTVNDEIIIHKDEIIEVNLDTTLTTNVNENDLVPNVLVDTEFEKQEKIEVPVERILASLSTDELRKFHRTGIFPK